MILIADSGSTKTDWVLVSGEHLLARYRTIGFNPYFTSTDEIYATLRRELAPQFDASLVNQVHFYGAGCSNAQNNHVVLLALSRQFRNAAIFVNHDMLAAARALLGRQPGFAAIIGTGSNTCLYNGKEIERNIDSLGYLLGDEGSGSYIGKRIVRDFMRGYLPTSLQKKFIQTYDLRPADIFDALYNQPLPNRFLAGFCAFANSNSSHEYIKQIVNEAFTDLFRNLVSRYPEYSNFKFNCVGSVGAAFTEQLNQVAATYKMPMGKVIASPIDDLVKYHLVK